MGTLFHYYNYFSNLSINWSIPCHDWFCSIKPVHNIYPNFLSFNVGLGNINPVVRSSIFDRCTDVIDRLVYRRMYTICLLCLKHLWCRSVHLYLASLYSIYCTISNWSFWWTIYHLRCSSTDSPTKISLVRFTKQIKFLIPLWCVLHNIHA